MGRSPAATLESEGAAENAGDEKVETNDGTTKFGLPCVWRAAPAIEAETETAKADAWDCKLDENVAGTPPATLELASALGGVWSAASACLTAATTEARKAGDGTSACPLALGRGL